MNKIQSTTCSYCETQNTKIWRVYRQTRFCHSCYERIFKHRPCPQCGVLTKLPKNIPEAICTACEKTKPCLRCGKTSYKIGKLTQYGPVCNSCAVYFREPEPCENCGSISLRLTRISRTGNDLRICPKCARADYDTCAACRRYRLLSLRLDGKMVCKKCLEEGEILCSSCGGKMPAGRGKTCETCYWANTLKKRVLNSQAGFINEFIRSDFGEFMTWLAQKNGSMAAALKISHYFSFFSELDVKWDNIITYKQLLEYFGIDGLRRYKTPMQWMQESRDVYPCVNEKQLFSESRKIRTMVATIPSNSTAYQVITDYQKTLQLRIDSGKLSIRSARLALRPAISVLLLSDPNGHRELDQQALERYLLAFPGQKAAITGFIRFLKEYHGSNLITMTPTTKYAHDYHKNAECELIKIFRKNVSEKDLLKQWIAIGLKYFHNLPPTLATLLAKTQHVVVGKGIEIHGNGQVYWVPYPFSPKKNNYEE